MSESQLALGVSSTTQPRGVITISGSAGVAGTPLPGWLSFEVTQTTYFEASSFRAVFAASLLPAAYDPDWWSQQSSDIFIEIFAGFPSDPQQLDLSELTSLIAGRVDSIDLDLVQGLLTITGRDYAGAFIDNKLIQNFVSQSASRVVTTIATARGVPIEHIEETPPSETVGQVSGREPYLLSVHQSEWDLICGLARGENFVAYMTPTGGLYWGPDPAQASGVTPYRIMWQPGANGGPPVSNAMRLSLSRDMTIARGVAVKVMSYSLKTGKPFTTTYPKTARSITPGAATPYGPSQLYQYVLRGSHSPQEAEAYAEAKYQQIIAHEMRLSARFPADDILTPQMPVVVSGTGTPWDQTYYPQRITRGMDISEGYWMTLEAKNEAAGTSPQS